MSGRTRKNEELDKDNKIKISNSNSETMQLLWEKKNHYGRMTRSNNED